VIVHKHTHLGALDSFNNKQMSATNNNNNNNLRLIMAKTNRSTLHTVYNIQQSAMQQQ